MGKMKDLQRFANSTSKEKTEKEIATEKGEFI